MVKTELGTHRKNLDAAWASFEKGLDDMVREEEVAFRRIADAAVCQTRAAQGGGVLSGGSSQGSAVKEIQEETEAAQARAAEILASARALVDAELALRRS